MRSSDFAAKKAQEPESVGRACAMIASTAIPHARPPAVPGTAPQKTELIRGQTLAAMFWFVARWLFWTKECIGCSDQGSVIVLCEAHARQAGRLRRSATQRNPTAWTSCSPGSSMTSLALGRSGDGSEDRRSRPRPSQPCSRQRARRVDGNRGAQRAAAPAHRRAARGLPGAWG